MNQIHQFWADQQQNQQPVSKEKLLEKKDDYISLKGSMASQENAVFKALLWNPESPKSTLLIRKHLNSEGALKPFGNHGNLCTKSCRNRHENSSKFHQQWGGELQKKETSFWQLSHRLACHKYWWRKKKDSDSAMQDLQGPRIWSHPTNYQLVY